MFTLLLHGVLAGTVITGGASSDHQVLVEECGLRLVEDWDLDRGERLLVVQDTQTDDVLMVERADPWADITLQADALDLYTLAP